MQQCGSPGARWELTTKQIVVCYELIREFVQLYRGYGQMALVAGPVKMSKNKKGVAAAKAGRKSPTQKALRSNRVSRYALRSTHSQQRAALRVPAGLPHLG